VGPNRRAQERKRAAAQAAEAVVGAQKIVAIWNARLWATHSCATPDPRMLAVTFMQAASRSADEKSDAALTQFRLGLWPHFVIHERRIHACFHVHRFRSGLHSTP
jgi:hypothetical protein